MSRYSTRAVFSDPHYGTIPIDTILAIHEDHVPVKTGLLDQHGVPIYRLPASIHAGFVLPRPAPPRDSGRLVKKGI